MIDHKNPDVITARAADPFWQAEQERKREAASARYVEYREKVGLPLKQKGRLAR